MKYRKLGLFTIGELMPLVLQPDKSLCVPLGAGGKMITKVKVSDYFFSFHLSLNFG